MVTQTVEETCQNTMNNYDHGVCIAATLYHKGFVMVSKNSHPYMQTNYINKT